MIRLCDGKYEFFVDAVGNLRCARYENRDWREFIGDNAVLALFHRCGPALFRPEEIKRNSFRFVAQV